jgi:hypothetical protein
MDQKLPTTIHGPLGITYHLKEKANMTAGCLENHERQRVQALLASVDDTQSVRARPCDLHKLADSLKLRKACGLNGI